MTSVIRRIFASIYFKIFTTGGILVYLYSQVNFRLLLPALQKVNYPYLPLLIGLIWMFWCANILSLYVLVLPIAKIPFSSFFKHQLKSILLGSITPMQIGEATIVVYLKKMHVPVQRTLSAFFLNKCIHIVLMLLTGSIFLYQIHFPYLPFMLIGYIVFVVGIVVSIHSQFRVVVRDAVIKKYWPKYYDFFELSADYLRKYVTYLVLNIMLNMLKVLLAGLILWLNFFVFRVTINFGLLLAVFNFSRIVALLPISIGGLGILEGGVAGFLAKLGFTYSIVMLAMFFLRILTFVLAFMVLLYYVLHKEKNA